MRRTACSNVHVSCGDTELLSWMYACARLAKAGMCPLDAHSSLPDARALLSPAAAAMGKMQYKVKGTTFEVSDRRYGCTATHASLPPKRCARRWFV